MHLESVSSKNNHLIGSRCDQCGAVAFPKRAVCHKCQEGTSHEFSLSKTGKLASYTVAWAAPEGIKPPFVLGYIDMPEGVRLLSMITGCELSTHALTMGQEMKLVFEVLRRNKNGDEIVAFKFKPVVQGEIS